jgi:release factor glutamine methyltransferase
VATTVGEVLRGAAPQLTGSGSETPRLDAEVLLAHVLRVDRATLIAGPEAGLGADHAREFALLVERRARGEPVSYIRGLKEFYGLAFVVDPRALIPRPETETLVDLALGHIAARLTAAPREPGAPLRVWDVGTGSGAIAVAIAVESRRKGYGSDIRLCASDLSADALGLAIENAVVHGVADAIEFVAADLTEVADSTDSLDSVDLLVANLPYIPSAMIPTLPVAASFEPRSALDGGEDGLGVIRRLIAQLPDVLGEDGAALLEIGSDQAGAVQAMVAELGHEWSSTVQLDLAGSPRVIEIVRDNS